VAKRFQGYRHIGENHKTADFAKSDCFSNIFQFR